MEFFQVLSPEQAKETLQAHLPGNLLSVTRVPIIEAIGRRLAEAIKAGEAVPGFNRSTVDGFAVRARDTFGASEGAPMYLELTGEVLMGQAASRALAPGQTVKIATGGMLPPGADAVMMVEYTEELDRQTIGMVRSVGPGENVIEAGEDIPEGAMVLSKNHMIRPQDLGVLAALGIVAVPVYQPLEVGIISTGDEVISPEQQPQPGQVRDINSYSLYGQVVAAGGKPALLGLVPDDYDCLKSKLKEALGQYDVILISGGSSVGTRDVTETVIADLGHPGVLFHGVALRPGKPTIGAVIGEKIIFGLPGHPASAMVAFSVLVQPLIKYGNYENQMEEELPLFARISRNLASRPGREDFVRVKLRLEQDVLWADPILGKSGLISTLTRAEGLARIPLHKEGLETGDLVEVRRF